MFTKNIAGLSWSAIFCFEKRDADDILENARERNYENNYPDSIYCLITDTYHNAGSDKCPEEFRLRDGAFERACYIATLKLSIADTTFAHDILTEEEYTKACNLYERGQYNSALLKNVAAKAGALTYSHKASELILKLVREPIGAIASQLREEVVLKNLKKLKERVDEITSGVKCECYLAAATPDSWLRYKVEKRDGLDRELDTFIVKKYNYHLGVNSNWYYYDAGYSQLALKLTLLNDREFWAEHKDFDLIVFFNAVKIYNDEKRAQKLLDAIFDSIAAHPIGAEVIKNGLSLNYLFKDRFINCLNLHTVNSISKSYNGRYDISGVNAEWLVYPLQGADSGKALLGKGRELCDKLFSSLYGADANRVKELLGGLIDSRETIKVSKKDRYIVPENLNVIGLLECRTFGYGGYAPEKKAVEVFCPDYFSKENVFSRLYLKVYALFCALGSESNCFSAFYELYYNLFSFIESKTGLENAYQLDTVRRESACDKLCDLLGKYGISTSKEHRDDYTASLLDRKIATRREAALFPVLEQLGDAVYNLAVAEMLFYNVDIQNNGGFGKTFEDHTRAEGQIKISTAIGLDKLYLASSVMPEKYEWDMFGDEEDFNEANEHGSEEVKDRFYADELEMVIGAVCRDCGYRAAINFAKRLLREVYPNDFGEEVRWGADLSAAEKWYWSYIRPAPFTDTHHSDADGLYELQRSFNKFFLCHIIGTEEKETRNFITHFHSNDADDVYGAGNYSGEVGEIFYEYLQSGLEATVEKFADRVKNNYAKNCRKAKN